MLHRDERYVDAGELAERARPLPRGDNGLVAPDAAFVGQDCPETAALDVEAGHAHALADRHAPLARALGERHGDIRRRCLAVGRQEGRAHHVAHLHQRPDSQRFLGCHELHLEAERLGRGRLSLDLDPALRVAGEPQAAVSFPASRLASFRLEPVVERDRVAEKLCDVGARSELPDEARRVPGGARRKLSPLEQDHVLLAHPGKMIGDRAADDAAADDDDLGRGRKLAHDLSISRKRE